MRPNEDGNIDLDQEISLEFLSADLSSRGNILQSTPVLDCDHPSVR